MDDDPTRRKIVEGAKRLFQLYGFTRITVDEIAANLKISKKTIYRHFPTKDALILGVMESIQETFGASMVGIFESDEGFSEKIAGILNLLQTLTIHVTPPMMQDMRNMPHVWDRIDAYRRQMISSNMSRLIEKGQRAGDIRRDLDPRFMTQLFITLVSALVTPGMMLTFNMAPHEFIGKLATTLMRGILTDKGREKLGGTR
jgi:AcrR family transcriptional regulator